MLKTKKKQCQGSLSRQLGWIAKPKERTVEKNWDLMWWQWNLMVLQVASTCACKWEFTRNEPSSMILWFGMYIF